MSTIPPEGLESGSGSAYQFSAGQKLFDRYTLTRLLGRGGMGVVWLAHDDNLDQDVALKFLSESMLHDPNAVERLKKETRHCLQLTHSNIVRIYDFVQSPHIAAIAMEHVDGWPLSAIKVDKPNQCFTVEEIKPWVRQLCDALEYAHTSAHIVHRDLKPGNLLIDARGQLKVSDFGVARNIRSGQQTTTTQGFAGTVEYMSPQQAFGEETSVLDDIYSLGATIFELLTGTPPFYKGDILAQVRDLPPPTMTERLLERGVEENFIPYEWDETIAACLAKNPARRPQSAAEVLRRLETTLTRPTTPVAAEPLKPSRSGRKLTPLVLGIAAVVLAASAFFLLSKKGESSRAGEVGSEIASENQNNETGVGDSAHVDAVINPNFDAGSGPDGKMVSWTVQSDGKILISGTFERFNGVARKGFCRLNANGSVDEGFNPKIDGNVHDVAVAPNGKILIAGDFPGTVARLLPDGSRDKSFVTGAAGDLEARSLAVQPDGKVLVGGSFTRFNNLVRNRIARLNPDGSVDPTFDAKEGANDIIWSIWPREDGSILLSGKFTEFAGKPCNGFAQVNAQGVVGRASQTGQGPNKRVSSFLPQPDGKGLISGEFTSYDGVASRIVRLKADGSVDPSFKPVSHDGGHARLAADPAGGILMAGGFKEANGLMRRGLARLRSDGTIDSSFDVIREIDGNISKIKRQDSDHILINGSFTEINGLKRNGFAQLVFRKGSTPVEASKVAKSFVPLFNGQDLTGWHGMPHQDPRKVAGMSAEQRDKQKVKCKACGKSVTWAEDFKRHWRVEGDELVNDGHGPYATTDKEFVDIELQLQYRTVPRADSGVYLRGSPQVQIWDYTETEKFKHGAEKGSGGLWNNSPGTPGKDPLVLADKPFGEWNKLSIIQAGDITTVYLNDKLVVDHAKMENYWDRDKPLFSKGPIQLQTHGGEIRWRNIYIRELTPEESQSIKAKGAAKAGNR